jgi:methylated-DNA-[protein]-cysteine S-methyltransferase
MGTAWSTYESPIGTLTLVVREGRLRQLRFPDEGRELSEELRDPRACERAHGQLGQYFGGERQAFELPVELAGSPFERAVWAQLLEVPFGTTVSYGELAKRLELDRPEAARDVGAAVGRTPVPIVVPCHRVIAANGDLTGYRGGLDRKRALLSLEARVAGRAPEPAWAYRQLALG